MFKRVLITSGPTREPIDPVRFVSNRSSGKTGFHIAMEARRRGIPTVHFVTGPTCFLPEGVEIHRVETALQMRAEVLNYASECDVVIMAAAVADYRVETVHTLKIKKTADRIRLDLVKNPDIIAEVATHRRPDQILVGFAAETNRAVANAREKLNRKGVDLIVLNEISQENPAFEADENQVHFVTRQGVEPAPPARKADVARRLWDFIYRMAEQRNMRR